ncbi:transposase [Prosthecobacter fluviatilis]|uniref:Transposase n=2 Tax=Prosthecobacter fluviatilis TaxID=445931 RepID=A0ABW0KM54_9BACT
MLLQILMLSIGPKDFVPFDWNAVAPGYQRNLPHITQPGVIYFITFRLADAVPAPVAARWGQERDAWMQSHPKPWGEQEETEFRRLFTLRMERWMDAGHGSCLLRQPMHREEMQRCLLHGDAVHYDLGDFVIMPNHVHLLLKPTCPGQLQTLLRPIKGVSARNINQASGSSGALWQGESFDHIMRSLDQLERVQEYIRHNPVKAGLKPDEFTYVQRWQVMK